MAKSFDVDGQVSGAGDQDTCDPSSSGGETFAEVVFRRLGRRDVLRATLGAAPLLVLGCSQGSEPSDGETPGVGDPAAGEAGYQATLSARPGTLRFQPVPLNNTDEVVVPDGYQANVIIGWGDPLVSGLPPFDINTQTAALQEKRFGQNCDFIAYCPLPGPGAGNPSHALLSVNHEFTEGWTMFPNFAQAAITREQADIEMAAHGVSIVEVKKDKQWKYVVDSRFNRRITANTPCELTGPLAGHDWLKTSEDPTGRTVKGTLNDCGGGKTPWGTVLVAEENWSFYFGNLDQLPATDPRKAVHKKYGIAGTKSRRLWELHHSRFSVGAEPNEPFRFGYVVEIDPYDPTFVPKKRTALGRKKHECAETVVGKDRRIAIYTGEDERFHYIYKFVTAKPMAFRDRAANLKLLDEGTNYVAKFNDDGTGVWVPLVGGQGNLTSWSPSDVLLNTRGAAEAAGGTKMDKPEDVARNPLTGKVYFSLTGSSPTRGTAVPVDNANPRANNLHGHIIEITEDDDDSSSLSFRWDIFMLCGDPANAAHGTYFAGYDPAGVSPIACPDNLAFDRNGNLWISTDGQGEYFGKNDGIHAVPVMGAERGYSRMFASAPVEAEFTGPEFNSNFTTLFCSVMHPGRNGTVEAPTSSWPEGAIGSNPRPSVVAIVKKSHGGGRIGG